MTSTPPPPPPPLPPHTHTQKTLCVCVCNNRPRKQGRPGLQGYPCTRLFTFRPVVCIAETVHHACNNAGFGTLCKGSIGTQAFPVYVAVMMPHYATSFQCPCIYTYVCLLETNSCVQLSCSCLCLYTRAVTHATSLTQTKKVARSQQSQTHISFCIHSSSMYCAFYLHTYSVSQASE